MKWIGTLIARKEGDNVVTFCISPANDVWFVDDSELPPDLRGQILPLAQAPDITVLGHLFEGEK